MTQRLRSPATRRCSDMGRGRSSSGGTALAKLARSQSWEDFRAGMRDRETVELMKANGIRSPKQMREYWIAERERAFSKYPVREMSLDEAKDAVEKYIPRNVRIGWFRDAESEYKPHIETAIYEHPELRNAGLAIAYHNFRLMEHSDISFDQYLRRGITLYRGERGQPTIGQDVFKSFSTDPSVARGFGRSVTKIRIRPIDTLGSYIDSGEAEYFVPTSKIGG